MMTHAGGHDSESSRQVARRALARVSLALMLAGSAVVAADPDGRAEWRMPAALSPPEKAPRANAPPVLGGIGPQTLVVGRPWQLHIRARDPDGDAPRLLVRGLPDGARLSGEEGGWHRLDWTPSADATGDVDLTVIAVDALDDRLRSERVVRLEVRAAERPLPPPATTPGARPTAGPVSERVRPPIPGNELAVERPERPEPGGPTAAIADSRATRALAPVIEPLASQIVSAGRTVSFRVEAALVETAAVARREPLLQIDRLPRNASFDANPDGTRTFYWPTGDSDQGEHRFRITALHPDDETLRSRVDLLVIVGDPTRAITEPLDEDDPIDADPSPETPVDDSPRSDRPPDPRPEPRPEPRPDMPSAPSPMPVDTGPVPLSPEDEPFLPQAAPEEADYWASGDGGADGYPVDPYDDPSLLEPDDPFFETSEPGYFDEGDGMPLGLDGLPLEP